MRNEYNIVKLNQRKNLYSIQLKGRCRSVLDEITCGVKEESEYEKDNFKGISGSDNSDEGDLIDLLNENRG